jgi:hypothetical protein
MSLDADSPYEKSRFGGNNTVSTCHHVEKQTLCRFPQIVESSHWPKSLEEDGGALLKTDLLQKLRKNDVDEPLEYVTGENI